MALNLSVSPNTSFCSATAKQSNPITLLDPSATATCRAKFKNVNMGMGMSDLSVRSDGIGSDSGSGRVHTVTRLGLAGGQVTRSTAIPFGRSLMPPPLQRRFSYSTYTRNVMAPKFEQLSENYLDVVFLKLDCNQENKPLAKELGIRVVSTFKILKDAKVVKQVTGAKFDDLIFAIESVRSA